MLPATRLATRPLSTRILASSSLAALLSCSTRLDPAASPDPSASSTTPAAVAADPQSSQKKLDGIDWQDFTPKLFETARTQKRLVLLDLGTSWCHWCHVMEETTYKDPAVVKLIREHYLAARVDADSRVDLANKYEEYGWPATIFFDAKATELVKMRGYLEPKRMAALLQACVDDPTPGPSARGEASIVPGTATSLGDELRARLVELHAQSYDAAARGFAGVLKYLPEWSVEYDLEQARRGDPAAERRAREVLTSNLELIDPAWGGVYQYSHGGDWDHPHFEKIMSFQSLDLRLYSQAFGLWRDESHRKAAQKIHHYLATFLRDDVATSPTRGAFYTSQDADLVDGEHGGEYFALDDAKRRALGVPRIDKNVYARENGWAIEALAVLGEATGDAAALAEAQAAARAMLATRRVEGGGFRHGERDRDASYLGDTLAMGAALCELHTATAERSWLDAAVAAADFIERTIGAKAAGEKEEAVLAGYPNARPVADATGAMPGMQRDENLSLARFANLLFRKTGEERFHAMTERALRYLVTPAIATRPPAAAVELVAREASEEPLHVTIVAPHGDAAARVLFERALRVPTRYKVVDWWSSKDPPLAGGLTYPETAKPTAYVCANGSCAPPVTELAELEKLLDAKPTN